MSADHELHLGSTDFGFSKEKDLVLKVIVITMSALSVLGSSLIIFSYMAWKDIRSTSRKLLVFLSICDFVTALFNGVGVLAGEQYLVHHHGSVVAYNEPTHFCIAQSVLNTYSSVGSFLWTTGVGVYLYLSIVHTAAKAERSVPVLHVFCWGVPAAVVGAALGWGALGYDPNVTVGWCWLRSFESEAQNQMWRLVAGKGWEMTSYIVVPILYILVKRKMRSQRTLQPEAQTLLTPSARVAVQEADRKLVVVPLVFVLLRLWGTVRFIMDWYDNGARGHYFFLAVLQAFGDSGQGFANSLLFCVWTKRVRDHFPCCWRQSNNCDSKASGLHGNSRSINDMTRFKNTDFIEQVQVEE